MSPLRRTASVVTWCVAFGLLALLLSVTWGLASEYGSSAGELAALVVVPAVVALVATGLGESRRVSLAVLGAFALVAAVGLPVSGALGQRDRTARFAAQDAGFTCNGADREVTVPQDVDVAFHVPEHPDGYWLYGPLQGSARGCTAGVDGDADASYAAWRSALLGTGWEVERDDTEVVVRSDGVRLRLYVADDLSMLAASVAP